MSHNVLNVPIAELIAASNQFQSMLHEMKGRLTGLEEFMAETPLTVGSPQQVIDRTLEFREFFGDYQRQLFLMDHAGLPLKTVLEQLDLLGEEVVPVLRREFAKDRPEQVPDAPSHASLLAARQTPVTA